jgi:hypothetical protein
MTGEHLWSDWMDGANLLPRGGEYVEVKSIFKGRRRDATSMFRRARQGAASTKKLKVVCEKCNNGWMSALEISVKPLLTPLIKGDPVVLDTQMREIIIEWIVMKVLVAEHNFYLGHPADPIFDQAARTRFMQSRAIPAGIRSWVAMQNGTKWVTGFHRHATGLGFTTTLPPPLPPPGRAKNVQVVTWGIGKLLIYLNATTDANVYGRLELNRMGPLLELWPLTPNNIEWPARFFVGDSYIDDLADALENFIVSGNVIMTC